MRVGRLAGLYRELATRLIFIVPKVLGRAFEIERPDGNRTDTKEVISNLAVRDHRQRQWFRPDVLEVHC